MAADSFDTSVPFAAIPGENTSRQISEYLSETPVDDNLGAFRGLVFALAIEGAFALLALGAWRLLHLLR